MAVLTTKEKQRLVAVEVDEEHVEVPFTETPTWVSVPDGVVSFEFDDRGQAAPFVVAIQEGSVVLTCSADGLSGSFQVEVTKAPPGPAVGIEIKEEGSPVPK